MTRRVVTPSHANPEPEAMPSVVWELRSAVANVLSAIDLYGRGDGDFTHVETMAYQLAVKVGGLPLSAIARVEGGFHGSRPQDAVVPSEPEADRWADLERLAREATQGPFSLNDNQCVIGESGQIVADYSMSARGHWEADAAYFSALAPAALLELIAAARGVRGGDEPTASEPETSHRSAEGAVVGSMRRIDMDEGSSLEHGGDLDDLAISGDHISLLRIERMSSGSCWGRIYMKDGGDIVLGWSAERGKLAVSAEADGFIAAPASDTTAGYEPQASAPKPNTTGRNG